MGFLHLRALVFFLSTVFFVFGSNVVWFKVADLVSAPVQAPIIVNYVSDC